MNQTVKRILNIIGLVAAVAVAVLAPVLAGMSPGTAWSVRLGVLAGILGTLKNAFGPAPAAGAIPQNELGPDAIPSRTLVSVVATPASEALTPRPGTGYPGGKLVALALLVGSLFLAAPALAQTPAPQAIGCLDAANTYCVVPSAAVGWQINLKTGGTANGVGLAGLVLQHTFGNMPLGIGIYGGLGKSTGNQGSYQGCIGVSVTNFGLICAGAQRASFKDNSTAWQGMLTFAGQLMFGGSPAYVREKVGEARVSGFLEGAKR